MTANIGPDYASIDKNNTPNLAAARLAGARFAIVRAVYGRGGSGGSAWVDPTWARDKDRITAAGLKRGAYLFLCYPVSDPNVHTPGPEEQADVFAANVQLTSFHDFVPFVDVEEKSTLDAKDYLDWTLRAVKRLKQHYGVWSGLYFSQRVWHECVGDLPPGDLINCPPWIAKPWPLEERSTIDLTGAPSYAPAIHPAWGANNYWLYQYQGDALRWPGFNSTVDASRFHVIGIGSKGEHVAWLQRRLGVTVDGDFGPNTRKAVMDLQTTYGLAADGIVGPDTFAVLAWHV